MIKSGIKGARETQRALQKLKDEIGDEFEEAGRAALQPTLEAAQANVDSEHVANALRVVYDDDNKKFLLGASAPNGGWSLAKIAAVATALEFGRIGRSFPMKPWLRPAYESTKDEIVEIFSDRIADALDRASKK